MLNDPSHLTDAVNKTYFQHFPEEVRPSTCITRHVDEVNAFLEAHGGRGVIKPLQGSGGQGVFIVDEDSAQNLNQIIEATVRDGYAIVQEYLPEASKGDLRVLTLNGRPLKVDGTYAAVRRASTTEDHRSNLSAGGSATMEEPDEAALRVAEMCAPKLIDDGHVSRRARHHRRPDDRGECRYAGRAELHRGSVRGRFLGARSSTIWNARCGCRRITAASCRTVIWRWCDRAGAMKEKFRVPAAELAEAGEAMHRFCRELFPVCRSLTGPGTRQTLRRIGELVPGLDLHDVPSGTQAFDWTVPEEWTIRSARLIGPDGETVVDFDDHNLHVLGYSEPVDREIGLEELQGPPLHLHSLPDQPDAIPYVTSYYKRRWGFCLPHRQREQLKPGTYRAVIDSTLEPGRLTYGEAVLPGENEQEIFLSTYVCHPSMANNELSGPAVTTWLARWLASARRAATPTGWCSFPETIGSIIYLSRNLEQLKERVIAGYNITCVGDERTYSFLPSRAGDTLADRARPVTCCRTGSASTMPIRFSSVAATSGNIARPRSTCRWRASCARNTAPTLNTIPRSTIWSW